MLLVAPTDLATQSKLKHELDGVESRFAAELLSDLPCVNSLVEHVERYRGKMLRPMLVLVSAMASSPSGDSVLDEHRVIATVAEMVHMATLVHDDVLDEADVRRRGSTINHLRGNETAVMLGDYLISHAYHLCSSLPRPEPARIIAQATNTVCEGELLQLANRENWELDEGTYYEIIRRKTASLCGICCKLAAQLNDAPEPVVQALYAYGEKLGVAFQIIDDLLDLMGTQETVGKSLGRDLYKGKLTLPLIHFISSNENEDHSDLIDLMRRYSTEPDAAASGRIIRQRLEAFGSVAYALNVATRLVTEAKQGLDVLEPSSAKTLLQDMADAVLTRKF